MAEDNQNRANEEEAELERIGKDPDDAPEGSENLGKQSASSGEPRENEARDE